MVWVKPHESSLESARVLELDRGLGHSAVPTLLSMGVAWAVGIVSVGETKKPPPLADPADAGGVAQQK